MGKIKLYLMTKKGHLVLSALIQHQLQDEISEVEIGKDKQVQNDYSKEISDLCRENNIAWHYRKRKNSVAEDARYAFAISWRWMIHDEPGQLIVFHDSLLPKYRGFAPLVNSLIMGENKLGVTALFASAEYDRGEIIDQSSIQVTYPLRVAEAIDAVATCYQELAVRIAKAIASGAPLTSWAQQEEEATYSLWRDEQDYRMDWQSDAPALQRFVDAVGFPYAGARCTVDEVDATVHAASAVDDVHIPLRQPGKVIWFDNHQPVVVCGKGLLKIEDMTNRKTGESLLPLARFKARFA